jgi:hypothetical protein
MPISIAGSGTITGISVGGIPDGVVDTDVLAANAVTTAKLGSAEVNGLAKAWVNFNGTGAVAIRDRYNVSSITDNGPGDCTVNFTTAMPDANFSAVVGIGGDSTSTGNGAWAQRIRSTTTSSVRLWTVRPDNGGLVDSSDVNVAIFR